MGHDTPWYLCGFRDCSDDHGDDDDGGGDGGNPSYSGDYFGFKPSTIALTIVGFAVYWKYFR